MRASSAASADRLRWPSPPSRRQTRMRAIEVGPAIEYNLFPYAEATRRELVLRYAVGIAANQYVDTTIFDKTREVLPLQVAGGGVPPAVTGIGKSLGAASAASRTAL